MGRHDFLCWVCNKYFSIPSYGDGTCPHCGTFHEYEEGTGPTRAEVRKLVDERDRLRRVVQHYRDNFKDYCTDACMEHGVAVPQRNQYPSLGEKT